MIELANLIWIFSGSLVAAIILGVAAGFSPTLYVVQASTAPKIKTSKLSAIAIMIGVLLAIISLSITFQFFQLNTLITFIGSTVHALVVSVAFNLFIGGVFIAAGIWYVTKKPKPPEIIKKKTMNHWMLVSLGFFRTFTSLSGATATFIASGLIANAAFGGVGRLILSLTFLAAVIAPFLVILLIVHKRPQYIQRLFTFVKTTVTSVHVRTFIGVVAIICGASIILFNVLMAISFR